MIVNDSIVEACARAAHEVNAAYCAALGDTSHDTWEASPDWVKRSARLGVLAVLNDPETTPEKSHGVWLAHKTAEGWTYGPEKDPLAKTHPCFRPYAKLPESQRRKDELFIATVRAVASALGVLLEGRE